MLAPLKICFTRAHCLIILFHCAGLKPERAQRYLHIILKSIGERGGWKQTTLNEKVNQVWAIKALTPSVQSQSCLRSSGSLQLLRGNRFLVNEVRIEKATNILPNSNLIIFEYVQTSYTFWSPKIIFRTCVLHSCYVNRFLVHAAQIEKVANYLQQGICHSNFQNFLQYFDHVLFPRNLQYNSCCETGYCIEQRLRKPANFYRNFQFHNMLNFLNISR